MSNYKKILVPVDFSAHSAEATRVGADLARRLDATLTLAYIYDPVAHALPDGSAMEPPLQLLEAFRAELANSRHHAVEAGALRVDTMLLQGLVAEQIVDFASRGEFDLIVMGTHGRTGMLHMVMGSIAERVVRLAPCPVLTVKHMPQRRTA